MYVRTYEVCFFPSTKSGPEFVQSWCLIHTYTYSTIYKKRYPYLESFGYELGIERLIHYIYKHAYRDRFNCNFVSVRRRRRRRRKDIFFYNSTGTITDAASAQLRIGLGL